MSSLVLAAVHWTILSPPLSLSFLLLLFAHATHHATVAAAETSSHTEDETSVSQIIATMASVSPGGNDNEANGETMEGSILDGINIDNAMLKQKSLEFDELRSRINRRLSNLQGMATWVQKEVDALNVLLGNRNNDDGKSESDRGSDNRGERSGADDAANLKRADGDKGGEKEVGDDEEDEEKEEENYYYSIGYLHDEIEDASLKLVQLTDRTKVLMSRVGEYNRQALGGKKFDGEKSLFGGGLEGRLDNVLMEEINRRNRYQNQLQQQKRFGANEEKASILDEKKNGTRNDTMATSSSSPYITLSQLSHLLHPSALLQPTEEMLIVYLASLAKQLFSKRIQSQDQEWNDHFATLHSGLEKEMKLLEKNIQGDKCLEVSQAMAMVANLLKEHYYDGTNMVDHASFENGGSVVYSLTSGGYQPPIRNNDFILGTYHGSGDSRKEAHHEYERAKIAEKRIEEIYRAQKSFADIASHPNSNVPLLHQLLDWTEKVDVWELYTSYKLGNLREYLPQDWERALDHFFCGNDGKQRSSSWEEYTLRGLIDQLIPDYVYHSLGMTHVKSFGWWFGRTAGPEVAITAGWSESGGSNETDSSYGGSSGKLHGGWSSKPLGNCYPLSMRPEDDPALSFSSWNRLISMGSMGDEEGNLSSLLMGPKFTVRLPYPIYIDAVTLEHRSLPVRPGTEGGTSAPRWVRVVGFPPCPKNVKNKFPSGGEDVDECGMRGFDVDHPIDLGSFEYHRITISDREDDHDGGNGDDESNTTALKKRRRSIQTFAVKGGKLNPLSLFDYETFDEATKTPNTSLENEVNDKEHADPMQCKTDSMSCSALPQQPSSSESEVFEEGQCGFPHDGNVVPSCGDGDPTSSSSSPDGGRRHMVEAVSFIIEENYFIINFSRC